MLPSINTIALVLHLAQSTVFQEGVAVVCRAVVGFEFAAFFDDQRRHEYAAFLEVAIAHSGYRKHAIR